ncbi:MAG: hypothetical protein RQ760_21415, partial [Sedimentisphaerales bacterium]|nr:hypothetical protein [Sedimentisphaerales bacterium]
ENRRRKVMKKQSQFKANKAKNKPNLSQYKPNSNPISYLRFLYSVGVIIIFCRRQRLINYHSSIINYKGLNICSNKLEWINFVKTVAYPTMEENAAEQIKSLLGVSK